MTHHILTPQIWDSWGTWKPTPSQPRQDDHTDPASTWHSSWDQPHSDQQDSRSWEYSSSYHQPSRSKPKPPAVNLHAATSGKPITAFSSHHTSHTHSSSRRSKPSKPPTSLPPPPPPSSKKRPKSTAPPSTRDGTELLDGEIYLDNLEMDDDHWPKMMEWAYRHPDRVQSPNEVPEAERPKPCIKIAQETVDRFSSMLKTPSLGHPGTHRHELGKGLWWSGSDHCHRPGGHLHHPPSIGQLKCSHHPSS